MHFNNFGCLLFLLTYLAQCSAPKPREDFLKFLGGVEIGY